MSHPVTTSDLYDATDTRGTTDDASTTFPATAEDVVRRWADRMEHHDRVIREIARMNTERAAEAMVAASLRSFRRLKPAVFEVGDCVRVSFLVLPSVRAKVKSRLLGEPVPLWSPKLYSVTRAEDHGGNFFLYDVKTEEDGDNEVEIGGWRYSLPSQLQRVDRRLLLHQPQHYRHDALGRRYPGYTDAAFLRAL